MRRFELDAKFWEATRFYGTIHLRWGIDGGLVKTREIHADSPGVAEDRLDELIDARLAEGYVEVTAEDVPPDPTPPPRWWGRFERGAAYLEVGLSDRTVRQRRGDTLEEELDNATRYATREAAREMVERITKLALASGHRLVHEGEPPMEPAVFDAELEAQCLAEPDNESPWAVYADWLIAQNDVIGELAALHLGGKPRDADQLLHANRRRLFGVNADTWMKTLELSWRHGFARGARIHSTRTLVIEELVRELLRLPIARLVDALHLESSDEETIAVVGESTHAKWLRELRLEGAGRVGTVWEKFPALEVLQVDANYCELGTVAHPKLRRLVSSSPRLYTGAVEAIAAAQLPNLEYLELALGDADDASAEQLVGLLRAMFASEGFPKLSHLGLTHCGYVEEIVPMLAVSPLVKRLRTLDLSNGKGARAAATALVNFANTFGHLEWVALDGNRFSAPQLAQIAKALPNARAGAQQAREVTPAQPRRVKKPPAGPVLPVRRSKR